jgi:hypothetical protein
MPWRRSTAAASQSDRATTANTDRTYAGAGAIPLKRASATPGTVR